MIDIPNYQIGKKIGQGGMASVYKAQHKYLPKEAAVKIMSSAFASQPIFQKCFIEEAKTINQFTHHHIVEIYDMGVSETDKNLYYITMEYLGGSTLQAKLAQGAIPFEKILSILKDLAKALQSVHNKGFIHRDIKPANIMFRENGDVVLTDFGIAKLEGSTGELTKMNLGVGSANYMAPEQARGTNLDCRVDIYSLGVIFYEMLIGKKPFAAKNTTALLFQHIHAEIPTLPEKYASFQPVLEKALAKNPVDRYSKVIDFIDDLNDVAALVNPVKSAPSEGIQKNNYKYILWVVFIVILAGGGYLLYKSSLTSDIVTDVQPVKQPIETIQTPPDPSPSECSFADRLKGKC